MSGAAPIGQLAEPMVSNTIQCGFESHSGHRLTVDAQGRARGYRNVGREPSGGAWERQLLLGKLAAQRRHVLAALEGLSDAQLRRPVLPSGWSCLGLVRHLTLSDERYWFETVVGGAPVDYWPDEAEGRAVAADWWVGNDESAADVLDAYRSAIARADELVATRELDEAPRVTEPWWEAAGLIFPDLRSVVVHMIVETATHAGHLDAAREMLDGHQHLVL